MNNYQTVRLGDVFDLQMGKTPDRKNLEYFQTNENKWISIADISKAEKYISETKECISDEAVAKSGIKQIPANTLIMSFKLSIGKTAITKEPMYSNEAIMSFLPNGKYETSNDFLYHLFSNKDWSEGSNKAVKGITLNKASLQEAKISLPPLSEQKHIAAILDKCTKLITKNRLMLEKYDTLIKSRFIELFGDSVTNSRKWQIKPIGDSCFVTKLAGFEYSKYIHYSDIGEVVMVKAQNVKNGKLNSKDLSYISNEVSDSLPRSQLTKNDVVMTYVGANIGDVAVIDDKYKYHLAPNVAKIRPDINNYNSVFLVQLLMMLRNYIVGNSADTAKAAIGMEKIRQLKIPVPPIELQNDFASFVQQIDKSKFAVQKTLEKAETLYKSLMQEYFG